MQTGIPPDGLFTPDVFCDLSMPRWRMQARGIEAVAGMPQSRPSQPGHRAALARRPDTRRSRPGMGGALGAGRAAVVLPGDAARRDRRRRHQRDKRVLHGRLGRGTRARAPEAGAARTSLAPAVAIFQSDRGVWAAARQAAARLGGRPRGRLCATTRPATISSPPQTPQGSRRSIAPARQAGRMGQSHAHALGPLDVSRGLGEEHVRAFVPARQRGPLWQAREEGIEEHFTIHFGQAGIAGGRIGKPARSQDSSAERRVRVPHAGIQKKGRCTGGSDLDPIGFCRYPSIRCRAGGAAAPGTPPTCRSGQPGPGASRHASRARTCQRAHPGQRDR